MLPEPRVHDLAVPSVNIQKTAHLVAVLRRLYGGPKPARQVRDRRLRQLAGIVETSPDDWKAIQAALKATGLSSAYLSVRFKEEAEMPLRSYALWCKFERACALVA
ncbi:MAG TPA: hypothetical protein VN764_07365, partial [Polyangiaceae bacterium]|nr:hypothetical protein [Polyangiaceae bacterium]